MKIGVSLNIDVTKIDKARLHKGAKGTYLVLTTFIDLDNKDQYDNNGFVAHKKKEGEQGNTPILGNVKVFWSDQAQQDQRQPSNNQPQQSSTNFDMDESEDIPF